MNPVLDGLQTGLAVCTVHRHMPRVNHASGMLHRSPWRAGTAAVSTRKQALREYTHVKVCEGDTVRRDAVEIGRVDDCIGAREADVTPPPIIGEDEHEIRPRGSFSRPGQSGTCSHEEPDT